MKTKELTLQSERNRKRLIEIIYKAKAGHIGGDLSCSMFLRLFTLM